MTESTRNKSQIKNKHVNYVCFRIKECQWNLNDKMRRRNGDNYVQSEKALPYYSAAAAAVVPFSQWNTRWKVEVQFYTALDSKLTQTYLLMDAVCTYAEWILKVYSFPKRVRSIGMYSQAVRSMTVRKYLSTKRMLLPIGGQEITGCEWNSSALFSTYLCFPRKRVLNLVWRL